MASLHHYLAFYSANGRSYCMRIYNGYKVLPIVLHCQSEDHLDIPAEFGSVIAYKRMVARFYELCNLAFWDAVCASAQHLF
uniref:Trafficking protein particle complex subunit n=1 Tax=Heterorhabditis bacteriophora TaxID=37862 RepID=A0A1I7XLQ3_HETBA